CSSYVGKNVLF
nr:immunoglobulin light chain junction region [Macaca mulatta]